MTILAKVMNHLDNTQFYEQLPDNPTERFSEEIRTCLINMLTFNFLQPKNSRTSRFYILPKLHKPGVPGRPIVSSCRASTEIISQFVDYHLGPLVCKIHSYIKDTSDFLLKLQTVTNVPTDSLLVALDVSYLYANIPHAKD